MDGGSNDIAARIAADHEALHAQLDRLLAAVAGTEALAFDADLRGQLDGLVEAARHHFHREEIWMDAAGLITLTHARDHDRLAVALADLVDRAAAGDLSPKEAVRQMAEALGDHEIQMDMAAFAIRLSPVTW